VTRLLGLDLTATELRMARAERRLGTTRLVSCTRVPCATPDARRAALESALEWGPSLIVAALPLAELGHRVLTLPFRDARRLGETVTLELVGQLPADPGDVVAGHLGLETSSDGTRVLAAVARRGRLASLCATLADAGAPPARVDAALVGVAHLVEATRAADAALLLADGSRSAVVVRRNGRLAGLRALATDPAVDPAAFDREARWTLTALGGASRIVLLGPGASSDAAARIARATGVATESIEDVAAAGWRADELAACGVAAGLVAGPGLVLHRAVHSTASPRRIGALAAAALLLAVADTGIVRWQLARRDGALVEAVRATASAALPAGTRIVAPQAQLEAAAGALARRSATAGNVLGLLREISARLPSDLRLALDELSLDGDVLRVRGRTDRFESIDVVARALAGSAALHDVAAEESRAAVDGNGVEFGLRATWRPAVGAPS
jgi:Tfp pilus assembly protein PilN